MFKLLHWFNFRLGVVGYMVSSTQLGGTLSDDKQKCQTKTRSIIDGAFFLAVGKKGTSVTK